MSTFEHIEIDRVGTDGRVARITLGTVAGQPGQGADAKPQTHPSGLLVVPVMQLPVLETCGQCRNASSKPAESVFEGDSPITGVAQGCFDLLRHVAQQL